MCLHEDIAKEARREGSSAFRDGIAIQTNPHQTGTRECSSWFEGWYAAERFALEEKLFPKEVKESDEYREFERYLKPKVKVPSSTMPNPTTDSFLSHWWWDKMERKRLFELWKDQE